MLVPEVNDELCPFHCTAVRIVPHEPCVTLPIFLSRDKKSPWKIGGFLEDSLVTAGEREESKRQLERQAAYLQRKKHRIVKM